jgi:hypothetical protein
MAAALGMGAPAYAAPGDLDAFRVEATGPNLKALAEAGFDVTEGGDRSSGSIEVVGTAAQLRATKVKAELVVDDRGDSAADRSRRDTPAAGRRARAATDGASDAAFKVWTKYDAVAGDGKEQYTEQYDRVVRDNPGLVARRATGTTYEGREIVALQVTKGATGSDIPGRPAVSTTRCSTPASGSPARPAAGTLDYVSSTTARTRARARRSRRSSTTTSCGSSA